MLALLNYHYHCWTNAQDPQFYYHRSGYLVQVKNNTGLGYKQRSKNLQTNMTVYKKHDVYKRIVFPGLSVIIDGNPSKKGTVLKEQGVCRDHIEALVFLVKVHWSSSYWLKTLRYFYCIGWWFFKLTGINLLFSWLLHRYGRTNSWSNFQTWVALLMRRNKLICEHHIKMDTSRKWKPGSVGIQGYKNSCHLDSILFSMFSGSNVFDPWVLHDNPIQGCQPENPDLAVETRRILRELIAIPLREDGFVAASNVWKLRDVLKTLCPEITGEFMAPEEVIYLIFGTVLNLPKFINYTIDYPHSLDTHSDYMHIMSVDPANNFSVITLQENFEASMRLNRNMRFARVPFPALIISWPWQDERLFHHEAIIPTFELNIQKLMYNERELCQNENCNGNESGRCLATWQFLGNNDSEVLSFLCENCIAKLAQQNPKVVQQYVSRTEMELTALTCYKNMHFTTFSKVQTDDGIAWVCFNSLAGIQETCQLEQTIRSITSEVINNRLAPMPSSMNYHERSFCFNAHTCFYEPRFYQP